MVTQVFPSSHLNLGLAHYPEKWSASYWADDIPLVKEVGFAVPRLAEFAWSTLEPSPRNFGLDWLDRALAQLAPADIVSVHRHQS